MTLKVTLGKESKQERTYAVLRERVLNGTYHQGHRLVIDAIARELGVSALPVREAIRRLEAEGWVRFRRNAGAEVAPVDESWWESAMTSLAVLEGYATRITTPLLQRQDLTRLREINSAMEAAVASFDVTGFSKLNRAFHRHIYDRCPNKHVVELLNQTSEKLDTVRGTMFTYIPYRGKASVAEHAALIDLMEAGGAEAAIEECARQHKLHTVAAFRVYHEAQSAASAGA